MSRSTNPSPVYRLASFTLLSLLLTLSLVTRTSALAQTESNPDLLVYHQITALDDTYAGVSYPEISADGSTIAFADSPGTGDPLIPNRIFTIAADGSNLTEVDSYQTLCFCGSFVDISADGAVVISSEAVQLRVADAGGARDLLTLAGGEIGAIQLTASGDTVYFLVRRDTGTIGGDLLPRGVWAIDTDGENLRQIVSAANIADLMGMTIEETGCCFYADGRPLAVSSAGAEIVFTSYGLLGAYVFAVDTSGDDLRELAGPFSYVFSVAISGDGATVAFDVVPLEKAVNEVGLVPFAGGEAEIVAVAPGSGSGDLLRLSDDGAALLLSPASYLVDTATGDMRQLAIATPGVGGHTAVLADGMPRAAMNADATRFVYAMNTVRCADCANQHEQLATLDIGPADLGAAPTLTDPTIDPAEIAADSVAVATATLGVESEGEVLAVGVVPLRDGRFDINLAFGAILLDDGLTPDARANDDIYANGALRYSPTLSRDDDTGPRALRYQAEIQTPDGLRHATAMDAGTLTVVAAP